ncbi:hypothetical protein GCM10029978_120040 [Actinoallomurus acanthiterrae]
MRDLVTEAETLQDMVTGGSLTLFSMSWTPPAKGKPPGLPKRHPRYPAPAIPGMRTGNSA